MAPTASIVAEPIESGPINPTDPGPIGLPVTTVLDEIADAVANYPDTDVSLTIVDISLDGDVINTGEQFSFRVKVTNRGPLTMKDVRLKAVAKNGAKVKSGGAIEQFGPEALSANTIETIAGGGGSDDSSALFIVQAPGATKPDGTALVEVTVAEWNAVWDYTLNRRSGASSEPKVTFTSSVEGS